MPNSLCPREMTTGLLLMRTTTDWNNDTTPPSYGTLCIEDMGNNKFSTRIADGINIWKNLKNPTNATDNIKVATGTVLAGTDVITLPWDISPTEDNILVFVGNSKLRNNQFSVPNKTTIKLHTTVVFDISYEVIYLPTTFGIPNQEPGYNWIVDGNFDFWYEGTSQTTDGYGSDTMWGNWNSGSTKVHSRQSFAVGELFPDGIPCPKYYSRTIVTSVVGANNYVEKMQRIEDVTLLAGKVVTFSFYAKADSAKYISFDFVQYFGTGGTPSATVHSIAAQKVLLSTTWTKYTFTFLMPKIEGMTLGTTDKVGFTMVGFWFDAGSTYADRSSNLGQQSGTFDLAKVSLVIGGENTFPIDRTYQEEANLISRYYFRITRPNSQYGRISSRGISVASITNYIPVDLPVPMRLKTPVLVVTNLANVFRWDVSGNMVPTSIALGGWLSAKKGLMELQVISASGVTGGCAPLLYQNTLTNVPIYSFDCRL